MTAGEVGAVLSLLRKESIEEQVDLPDGFATPSSKMTPRKYFEVLAERDEAVRACLTSRGLKTRRSCGCGDKTRDIDDAVVLEATTRVVV